MKNFSDLLDIKPEVQVVVGIHAISHNGFPLARICVNDQQVAYDGLVGSVRHVFSAPLLEPIYIAISLAGKQYSAERETAIVLDSIKIDGFEIIPNWTHLAQYNNERNINEPTSYLGYNGTWSFTIPRPFYQWHHEITGQGWLLEPVTC